MKVMIVTDAWKPQVNGVVTTLGQISEGLNRLGHETRFVTPQSFSSIPCPTYPEIRLSLLPYAGVRREIEAFAPDAIHIATEGPLGLAARRYCLQRKIAFTSAFHTRFAEYVHARIRVPVNLTYRWLRYFHAPSRALMVPTPTNRRPIFLYVGRVADALHADLGVACMQALDIPRETARGYAEQFSWKDSIDQFVRHLTPVAALSAA